MNRMRGGEAEKRNSRIREERSSGKSLESIGVRYGLTRARVSQICHGIKPERLKNRKSLRTSTRWGSICPRCGREKNRGVERCKICGEPSAE